MKPVELKSRKYINSGKEIINTNPKFKIGDIVRISKCKIFFAKGYVPDWLEEVFAIKKAWKIVPLTYVNCDLNREEIAGTFYAKEIKKILESKSNNRKRQ